MFIVLDGPDASGTSTHATFLAERLRSEGHDVVLTSEPTDGLLGKEIREYLKTGKIDPTELQMLFTRDRAWHVKHVIEPALKAGKTVICDRYWPSTIVYAQAQGLDLTELKNLNNKFIQQDITIFTLPPIELSLQRLTKRASTEIFEQEDLQRKIHEGYERMAREDQRIVVVDTSGEKSAVADEIWQAVSATMTS